MRHKRLKFSAVFLLGFGLATLEAQEIVTTTGGEANSSGGSVSFSMGQIAYQTRVGLTGSLSEGVEQPYEISEVTGIDETIGINLSVSAFPNSTNDYLTLNVKDLKLLNLIFQLYDINGTLLQNEKIIDSQTRIDMSNRVSATYFVKVIQGSKDLIIIKIIKK